MFLSDESWMCAAIAVRHGGCLGNTNVGYGAVWTLFRALGKRHGPLRFWSMLGVFQSAWRRDGLISKLTLEIVKYLILQTITTNRIRGHKPTRV